MKLSGFMALDWGRRGSLWYAGNSMMLRGLNAVAFRLSKSRAGRWWLSLRLQRSITQCLRAVQPRLAKDNLLITTFFNQNIPPEIPERQHEVMASLLAECSDVLWVPYNTSLNVNHEQFLDAMLKEAFRLVEHVLILDVDAIPLSRKAIDHVWNKSRAGELVGAEQCASHLGATHNYISPAIACLSKEVYAQLGAPSAAADTDNDVFERFTRIADERGVKLRPLRVSRYMAEPSWPLADGRRFGIGTYYAADGKDLFFHNFCSRKSRGESLQHFHRACSAAIR